METSVDVAWAEAFGISSVRRREASGSSFRGSMYRTGATESGHYLYTILILM